MKKNVLNVFWLTAMQASNAALPLIVFPFALAAVGDHYYSKLVVSEALAVFLIAVVLYSFEIDGVAGVVGSDTSKDRTKLSQLLCGIVVTRIALFVIFLPVLALIAWVLDPELVLPALAWSLIPLSYALQPNWFFQGLGQNEVAAAVTVASRGAAVLGTLLLVDNPSNYILVPIAIGVPYVAGAVLVLVYAVARLGFRWDWPERGYLRNILFNGRFVFFGNLGVTLYRDANVLVLAAVGAPSGAIAVYSLAEKLIKSIQAGIRPLNLHFLPHAMKIAQAPNQSRREKLRRLGWLTLPQIAALSAFILGLYLVYPTLRIMVPAVRDIGNLDEAMLIIGIMSIGALMGVANFMLGSAGLNAMGERQYMFRSIVFAGTVGVATCAVGGIYFGAYGAALAFVAAEIALQIMILKKYLAVQDRE